MNFLKAVTGMGMYSMPLGFSYTGLLTGVIATMVTAVFITHCVFILLRCANAHCRRDRKPNMTYAEVVKASFVHGNFHILFKFDWLRRNKLILGPKCVQRFGNFMKYVATFMIALTYFGSISVYSVIVAENLEQVIRYHFEFQVHIRYYIILLWIPLMALCLIPNLKMLAPLSAVSNIFTLIGLIITFYYCFIDMPIQDRPLHTSIYEFPKFFGISFVAMETIGIILPLEHDMINPEEMRGPFGVVNLGMMTLTTICIFLGFVGYAKYGDGVEGSIALNLPIDEGAAQAAKILVALAVFFTSALLFYIVLDNIWNEIEQKISSHETIINYTLRIALVTAAVLLAVAVPTIGPFVSLIGACFFSTLGLIFPVIIEILTYWDQGFGKFNWMIWKNVVIAIFGLISMAFGAIEGVKSIVALYT